MAHFVPAKATFSRLKDSIVCISGGATGIGAAVVKILASSGAKVVVGDINSEAAEQLSKDNTGVSHVRCDVTKYEDIYKLFRTAYDKHGRVDHAVSCAGIFEVGNWYDPELTVDTVKDHSGDTKTLDVNVIGSLHFARVASVFLRTGRQQDQDRSLLLLSSVNAWRDSPGLFLYQTGKHAVQGLLRSSRKILYERDGIRVNAVCPGVTDTPMTGGIIKAFKDANLFWQPPEAVANTIVGIQADTSIRGKAYYIEGGDSWEIEDSLYETQPRWLSEEGTRRMRVNSEAVQKGALDPNRKK